jgi:putative transposase
MDVKCKHIYAVEFSLRLRKTIESQFIIKQVNAHICPTGEFENVVKHGIRYNKSGDIQRFFCKACSKCLLLILDLKRCMIHHR